MVDSGLLSVLRNVIAAADITLGPDWRIVALVHRKELISSARTELIEFPKIKRSWLRRIWFEWVESREIARELGANVWLALHDITPLVNVERQFVYCHNPACFARPTLRSAYFDWIFVAHSLLYGLLYSLNINRNRRVFVQQDWLREAFMQRFGAKRVVVARPSPVAHEEGRHSLKPPPPQGQYMKWFYPTFPRHFKNIEIIGKALAILERRNDWRGHVWVTIDASQGRYARWLTRKYGGLKSLHFIGLQQPAQVRALYESADGLLFPSKLETWGLPITEAQGHGLAVLVADMQYARETVGTYNAVSFFDPTDSAALAALLHDLSLGNVAPGKASRPPGNSQHTLIGWDALIREVCL
jgi:glycosyltransferase involved in cell wall biosynthesis